MREFIVQQLKDVKKLLISHLENNKKTLIYICFSSIVSLLLMYNIMYSSMKSLHIESISQTIVNSGINEAFNVDPFLDSRVSLETGTECNLQKKSDCYRANKSLVVTFWRHDSRDKWLAKNFFKVFNKTNFVRIIMVHDNSVWSTYPDRESYIWIYVNAQKRFWYLKRFLTPSVLRAYKYLWIIDDDAELLFDTLDYECVITKLNVSLSAPGRFEGVASHPNVKVKDEYVDKIGRWTDFVEIGPILISSTRAWECIWDFLSPYVGLGWGLDIVWCRLLAHNCGTNATLERTCAILDIFRVNHLSNAIQTFEAGDRERPAYAEYYAKYSTQQNNYAPLANDRQIHTVCTRK